MARPPIIDNAGLLETARAVFLERGAGATTAEVAKRAGIAQGSIFRRYKTKADLFRAAMLSDAFPWMALLRERTHTQGLQKALVATAPEIIALFKNLLPVAMMSWSHRELLAGQKSPLDEIPLAVRDMFQLVQSQMEAGALKRGNPLVVTAMLLAPLLHYAFIDTIAKKHPLPVEVYAAEYVHTIWSGIAPDRKKRDS